jgi:hypothetical protein
VGYAGSFSRLEAVDQRGDPNETVATLDGVYVLFPYQWAGTYTIFDPHLMWTRSSCPRESSAFSYGQVLSGLLEVGTKTPTDSPLTFDFGLSTTGLDLFYQQASGRRPACSLGGKITWMRWSWP